MTMDDLQTTHDATLELNHSHSLEGAIVAETLVDFSALDYVGSDADRRRGVSNLEYASQTLAHAVQYLTSEQLAGRCTSVRANRKAILLLCDRVAELAEFERREPVRNSLAQWLRSL